MKTTKKTTHSFTVNELREAACNLQPIRCMHCNEVGEVVYHPSQGDGYCQSCGHWQLDFQEYEDAINRLLDYLEQHYPGYHKSDRVSHAENVLKLINNEFEDKESFDMFCANMGKSMQAVRNDIPGLARYTIGKLNELVDQNPCDLHISLVDCEPDAVSYSVVVFASGERWRVKGIIYKDGEIVVSTADPLSAKTTKMSRDLQYKLEDRLREAKFDLHFELKS